MEHEASWPLLVGALITVKSNLANIDPDDGYGSYGPYGPAAEEDLRAVESALGEPLDPSLRELLGCVDGWLEVQISTDLLSTSQLVDDELRSELKELMELTCEYLPILSDEWMVFARATADRTLVVVGRAGTAVAGRVLWLDGDIVDTYPTVKDWFCSVIAYHHVGLAQMLADMP